MSDRTIVKDLETMPETVKRLLSLEPGQTILYYRGNFEADMLRCDATTYEKKGAPNYKRLLARVRQTAQQLANEGLVRLTTHEIPRFDKRQAPVYAYSARRI